MQKASPNIQSDVNRLRKLLGILVWTSPAIIIPLDLFMIGFFIYIGHTGEMIDLSNQWWVFIAGFFTWTLVEYLMHRFAFHYEAKAESGKKMIYMLHIIHHDHPTDSDKLYQPPLVNLVIVALLFGFIYLIMNNFVFLFLPGIILGYLAYSTIHYSIHKFKPPFDFLKPIWRHHNLHHYRFQNKGFGVSSPFWDVIFGTMPPKEIEK
jgi:4-hydroxysphinganine ceramide fatty acyl 2-hydroxylase